MSSTEMASREASPADGTSPPAPNAAETPPAETAATTPPSLPAPATVTSQAASALTAANRLSPPPPEADTARTRPEDTAERGTPPPLPPIARTTEAPLPESAAKAPPPPSATKTEQASLPPEGALGAPGGTLQIPFPAGETELAKSAQEQLEGLAKDLRSSERLRVQLLAYAGDEGASPSKARRISLSRALAVRSYLIESGIKTSRIDVRALGNKTTSGSPDRVDVKVVER
jgi:outer membrane protein OmpA-like peptidoglycan-associated protein